MSTGLPKESSPSSSEPPYPIRLSDPPSSVKPAVDDCVDKLPSYKNRTTLRNHPYLRPRLPRLQDDPSNIATQSLARNRPSRRRLAVSSAMSTAHPITTVSMSDPSLVQQTRLDRREFQSQRLVRLFEIPEFFRVVREEWGAAFRAEKRSSAEGSTSTRNEEGNINLGLADRQ